MRLLSLDTSTSDLHVCLSQSGCLRASRMVKSNPVDRQYASASLIPVIDELMTESSWFKSELDAVVVGVGPGSFTGVRIAVVTARAIAQALELPLIGVSLMECYASAYGSSTGVALTAGKGNFYAAAYELVPTGTGALFGECLDVPTAGIDISLTQPPACVDRAGLIDMLKNSRFWLADVDTLPVLAECLDADRLEALPELNNIAEIQAKLALNRLSLALAAHDGVPSQDLLDVFPYEGVEPLYLRSASITLKRAK